MSPGVTPLQEERPGRPRPEPRVVQSSRLLPALFGKLSPDRCLTVLDVGPAMPETVRFFSAYRCRLHIQDLFEAPFVRHRQTEMEEAELKQAFIDRLCLPRGTLIDVCLFWDFLNYLTPRSLRALNGALRPYVHSGSLGHGFSVLNVETPLSNRRYGVVEGDQLCSKPARLEQLAYYPHTHEELNACLASFNIARGWLLADGRLEMLLEAAV